MPIIESVMGIQVIGNSGENIIKSPIVEAYIGSSLLDSTEVASDTPTDISTKVEQLMAAKHSHSNKAVLDKFAETDGKPTYGGEALGGGASTAEDISYTLSEDVQTTFPDIVELESDTVKSGLDVAMYYAIAGMFAKNIACDLPSATGTITVNLQSVMDGWHPILEKAHEHDNKSVLDKLSAADGKLQYNGSDVGLKGAAGTPGKNGTDGKTPVKGTDYWTEADKAEIVADTLAALPKWTGGNY